MEKDEIYLEVAMTISRLSKVEGIRSGAVIIASDGTPVSFGYSGTLSKVDDSLIPHGRGIEDIKMIIDVSEISDGRLFKSQETYTTQSDSKPYIYDGIDNAIHYAGKSKLVGSTLYTNVIPNIESAKNIVRAKISRVVCPFNATNLISNEFNTVLAILATGNVSIKLGNKEYKPMIIKENKE